MLRGEQVAIMGTYSAIMGEVQQDGEGRFYVVLRREKNIAETPVVVKIGGQLI